MKYNANNMSNIEMYSDLPEVTIIVITYNQQFEKIIKTLDSIVTQEEILFEIIICDDGSEKPFEEELRSYFSSISFDHYSIIIHENNGGTVSNYYSGLKRAKGKYTKLLSPGDFFSDRRTLYNWLQFLESNNARWSFSDAFYYLPYNEIRYIKMRAHPQMIHPYSNMDANRCVWNYIVFRDIALGAAIIGTTKDQLSFCEIIMEKGIKYSEDNIYRLMMFRGIVGCYYPEPTICYEYGTGVSTSGNNIWSERLAEDWNIMKQIMLDEKDISDQQKKMVNALIVNCGRNRVKKLFIKGKLYHYLKYHFFPRLTSIPEETK